jgi:hypothetical protein
MFGKTSDTLLQLHTFCIKNNWPKNDPFTNWPKNWLVIVKKASMLG